MNSANKMEGIRVDIDDRNESMGKKIRNAEKEWVPYILVLGKKETEGGIDNGKFQVRIRESGEQKEMTANEIILHIKERTGKFPFKPLPLPGMLSKRPKFVG